MLDQYNLFDTPENHTADTPSHTVVTPSSHAIKDTKPDTNTSGLLAYVTANQQLIWESETHRNRSLKQLQKFVEFDPKFASMELTDFGTDEIDAFTLHLLNAGKSHATINRYSATISRVFNYAYNKRKYPYPVKIEFYSEKDRNRIRVYSNDELAKIKDWFLADKASSYGHAGSEWMWDMCIVASKSGMRRMEIVSVARPVRGKMSYLTDDEQWLILPPEVCKTKKGRKIAMTNPVLLDAIKRLKVSLQHVWSDKTFYRRWTKMRDDLFPNDDEAVFHAMRHTAASKMANELKMNTVVIARALGHLNIATTEKYIHEDDDALLAASARM